MRAMKVSFSGNLQCLKHLDHDWKRVLGEIDVSCDYPIVVLPTRWRGLCESSRFINSGPVIGMSLLLIVLLYKETIPQSLESDRWRDFVAFVAIVRPSWSRRRCAFNSPWKRMACDCWFFDWLNHCDCVGDWLDSSATASRPNRWNLISRRSGFISRQVR